MSARETNKERFRPGERVREGERGIARVGRDDRKKKGGERERKRGGRVDARGIHALGAARGKRKEERGKRRVVRGEESGREGSARAQAQ